MKKSALLYFAEFISTGCYSGYLPAAPGTWGSLAAMLIALHIALNQSSENAMQWMRILGAASLLLGLVFSGLWAAETGEKDPPSIVIDEWAGLFYTYAFIELNMMTLIAGFILFRIFDIFKPWPANRIQSLPGGWGIMLDDVIAGFYAALVLAAFEYLYVIW